MSLAAALSFPSSHCRKKTWAKAKAPLQLVKQLEQHLIRVCFAASPSQPHCCPWMPSAALEATLLPAGASHSVSVRFSQGLTCLCLVTRMDDIGQVLGVRSIALVQPFSIPLPTFRIGSWRATLPHR